MTEQKITWRPNWDKLARACRRYLDAFNDEIADDIALGSVGNDLKIVVNRELPSAATQTAEQEREETAHSLDEFGFLGSNPAESKSSVKVTSDAVSAEIEGMRMVPTDARERPWVEVLAGPHPPEVSRAAGALFTITTSTTQRYMIAYRLYEIGLLAGSPGYEDSRIREIREALEDEHDCPDASYRDDIFDRLRAIVDREPFSGQSDGTPPSNPRGPNDEPCPTCDHYVSGCDHCNGVEPVTAEQARQVEVTAHELAGFLSTIGIEKGEGLKIGEWLLRGYRITDGPAGSPVTDEWTQEARNALHAARCEAHSLSLVLDDIREVYEMDGGIPELVAHTAREREKLLDRAAEAIGNLAIHVRQDIALNVGAATLIDEIRELRPGSPVTETTKQDSDQP